MSRLRLVSPDSPAAAPVGAELGEHSPLAFLPPAGAFVVLEEDGTTVAGGALRRLGPGAGEITRMWTAPAHRRRGHARRVLAALEEAAARRGYHTLRVEADERMTAAVGLYRSAGYTPSGNDGWYEKRLDVRDHRAADELDRGEILVRKMLEHHSLHARLRQAA